MEQTLPRGRIAGRTVIMALLASLAGCSSDTVEPMPANRAEIGWIAPAPEDTLRGTAEFAVWIDLGEPVREVSFFVDGEEVGTLDSVPWSWSWRPPDPTTGPDLRKLVLEVEARGERASLRHAPMEVWYRRDDPPSLVVAPPGKTDWVEIGTDRFLVASARDREDGEIDASMIEWRTDEGRRFRGSHFPSQLLSPGDRWIRARVTDRAGNGTEAEVTVHAFRFEGGESALGAAQDLQAALSALDLETLSDRLDPEFRMVCCGKPSSEQRPDPLSRNEFLAALGSAASDPGLARLLWGGQIELRSGETRGWALAAWHQLGVLVNRNGEEWRTVGLSAELVLRRRSGGDWQVVTWRETDPGDGPGALVLLHSRLPYP